MTKLKEPSFQRVNSPLELPVMQRVTPAGAQARQNTGHRCLLVDVFTHCNRRCLCILFDQSGEGREVETVVHGVGRRQEKSVD